MNKNRGWLIGLLLFSLGTYADEHVAPVFPNIGVSYFKADSKIPLAEKYFNQGNILFFAENYLEAIRSYRGALAADFKCQRCLYMLALTLGSPTQLPLKGGELKEVKQILESIAPKELLTKDLVSALKLRYDKVRQKTDEKSHSIVIPLANKIRFSNAMHALTKKYPEDDVVYVLFAYAIRHLEKQKFYDKEAFPKPYTEMILSALKKAMILNADNIGALHYYIHVIEKNKQYKEALFYAKRLTKLAPNIEHFAHMPVSLYYRLGNYSKAIKASRQSVLVFSNYSKQCQEQGFEPEPRHVVWQKYDLLFTDSLMAGAKNVAWQIAAKVHRLIPRAYLRQSPTLLRFYALHYFTEAHFGLWQKVDEETMPEKSPYLQALWHYVKGLAASHRAKMQSAKKHLKALDTLIADNAHVTKELKNSLLIGSHILQANIAYKYRLWDKAIMHIYEASLLQDKGADFVWYFPMTEALGFAFIKAKKWEEALATFQVDLKAHPKNGWSLYGLSLVYKAQGKKEKSLQAFNQYKLAFGNKSVSLPLKEGSDMM